MREATAHPTPGLPATVREQLRAVGIAVRRETAGLALFAVVPSLGALFYARRVGETLSFGGEDVAVLGVMAGAVALIAPVAVWKGEARFGSSPLWCLPVGHRRHALVKAAAGWAWLMVAVAAGILWLRFVTLLGGGTFGAAEAVRVLDASTPSGVRSIQWATPIWQWLGLFTGATVAYLLGSALLLGTRHPWRWMAGVVVGSFLLVMFVGVLDWERGVVEPVVETLGYGRYGVETVLAGGLESLETVVPVPGGERVAAFRELPTLGRWAAATLLWTAGGLAALLAAASRQRGDGEGRLAARLRR